MEKKRERKRRKGKRVGEGGAEDKEGGIRREREERQEGEEDR